MSSDMGERLKAVVGQATQLSSPPPLLRTDLKPGRQAQAPLSVMPFHGYCVLAKGGQPPHGPPPRALEKVPVRHCPTVVSCCSRRLTLMLRTLLV